MKSPIISKSVICVECSYFVAVGERTASPECGRYCDLWSSGWTWHCSWTTGTKVSGWVSVCGQFSLQCLNFTQ